MITRKYSLIRKLALLLASTAMLGACEAMEAMLPEVGPDYVAPTNSAFAAYKAEELGNWSNGKLLDKIETKAWWEIYHDTELNELEAKLLKQNQQLKAAYARLNQARATARVDRSFLLPTVDANGFWTRTHTALTQVPGPGNVNFTQMGTPLDLSYEVDLWGRVRRSFESARAEAQASDADYYGLRLTQLSDLAEDYFTLRSIDDKIASQLQIVQSRSSQLELGMKLRESGLDSESDLNNRKVQLDAANTEFAALKLHRDQLENAIAVLVGENPSSFHLPVQTGTKWNSDLPQIPAGLPSELLERRPDISSAERELAAANARIGVAKAAFFPVVTLTGSGGYISADVDSLFNWPSRAWSIGPSVSLPLFSGGRNRANLGRAKAAYDEAIAKYRDRVLVAFSEVENSFVAIERVSQEQESAQKSTDELNENLKLSRQRLAIGLADQIEVFESEQAFLNSNKQLSELKSQHLIATVEAFKALGGGWDAKQEYGQ
jgi:multidrug efflux system outer membrane protein